MCQHYKPSPFIFFLCVISSDFLFFRNIKSLSPNFSFSLPAGLHQKPMCLQVSSNKLSHSKFKFIITKPNMDKFQNPEKERETRPPLFHLFKNPFPNAFSSDLRFSLLFLTISFTCSCRSFFDLRFICMEIWCSFVSKLTDMESVLAGRGLLFFYGSGHWILQSELIYYNRTQPHFCRTPESPNHKNAFFVLHRFINDNRRLKLPRLD
ncbi:hypothetical protein HanRHA438_Chr00c19g0851901 [Helianthus annuus]|nr:hypothetical protein HanHA300_Chr13g0465981 [Helianthus annuus]KAJ0662367.1 hypothetical protein HanLR1_Chr13g0468601 [Helianthus annuus]KAJ0954358.1 hypothetical protein HanRHA438_Chr00c19g0851901 [Helianthus annuus]